MRRLPKDGIVFHAYCEPFDVERWRGVVESLGPSLGLSIGRETLGMYPSWLVGTFECPFDISANPSTPWSELHIGVNEQQLARHGAGGIVALFAFLAERLGARLGRTTALGGVGYVSQAELDGQLEFVDWAQYWAEPIVRRWGAERLRAGPFARVETRERGACLMLLAHEPDDKAMSRQAAADFLGIHLRALYAQVEGGKKTPLSWR